MRKVKFETYIKDAKNGKKTVFIDEDQILEIATTINYDDKGGPYHKYLIDGSKWGEMNKEINPDFVLSDETADFYRIF